MDKIAVAYSTTCTDKKSGAVLMARDFEAISKNEAESRALLNCVKAGNKLDDVVIEVKRNKT